MDLEPSLREIASDLLGRAAGSRPALFEPRDWLRKMIERSLDDERMRTALFRFVDVLPSLSGARDVGSHLEEYFAQTDHALGGLSLLAAHLHAGWVVAPIVRQNVVALARRFIAEDASPGLGDAIGRLRAAGAAFTLDLVGETVVSEREAQAQVQRYERLLDDVAARAAGWPEAPRLDRDARGPIARVQLSIKLSSLHARFDPLDPQSEQVAGQRLRKLLREAGRLGAALAVDMESRALKEATLSIVRSILEDDEFGAQPPLGVALQAYLPETEADLAGLIEIARARSRRLSVRLVKGAYWDSELAWASQKGWPAPVFTDKAETDAAFEHLSRMLLDNHDVIDAAFGSHNLRSVAHAIAYAGGIGLAPGSYEIQMLQGMAEPLRRALVARGERVRIYLPVGDLVPGMAYLIRRLLENTSNVSFLRQRYVDGQATEALLAPPQPRVVKDRGTAAPVSSLADFRNEPPLDFSHEPVRERFGRALDAAHAAIGGFHPLRLAGVAVRTGRELVSVNPAAPSEVVGRVAAASAAEAAQAVAGAAEAFAGWSRTPVEERAAVLSEAAAAMRARREELAAAIVLEVGKGWRDADAEVCEAIDYLEYYGRETRRFGSPLPTDRVRGEENEIRYQPLGVTAVIAPWNFPLAIAAGMSGAALAAGNTVVLKPAEQSPVLGAELAAIWSAAGLPPGACELVQGGGEIGAALVAHPEVRAVAFTGSRAVGLEIQRAAAASAGSFVKRAICEMGGKNAIIVDRDADQDEALLAILESAFGYQGQKCSAASRLIVVGDGPIAKRLVEATRTLRIGPPEDPRNHLGPLIDADALERVVAAVRRGVRDGRLLCGETAPLTAKGGGYFVAPAILDELPSDHELAQEEIFGPVLVVLAVKSFGEAVEIANATPYGLTAGVFSRSPANLEHARRELRVGNLYLNRGITGAVVRRQPFGGLKLSGVGWKAGGPDYLRQFLESRTIAENTLRHGFAPRLVP